MSHNTKFVLVASILIPLLALGFASLTSTSRIDAQAAANAAVIAQAHAHIAQRAALRSQK